MINLSDSNYPYLEQISMVPKMFEPLKFDRMLPKHGKFVGRNSGGEVLRHIFELSDSMVHGVP